MVFCNEGMLNRYPQCDVVHLSRCGSDHVPIALYLEGEVAVQKNIRQRPFRFEAMWFSNKNCMEVIRNGWTNPGSSQAEEGVGGKLSRYATDLKDWESVDFGHMLTKLKKVRKKLEQLASEGMDGEKVKKSKKIRGGGKTADGERRSNVVSVCKSKRVHLWGSEHKNFS